MAAASAARPVGRRATCRTRQLLRDIIASDPASDRGVRRLRTISLSADTEQQRRVMTLPRVGAEGRRLDDGIARMLAQPIHGPRNPALVLIKNVIAPPKTRCDGGNSILRE